MNYSCEGEYEASIAAEAEYAEAEQQQYYEEIKSKIKLLEFELEKAKNDIDLVTKSSIEFPSADNIKQWTKLFQNYILKYQN